MREFLAGFFLAVFLGAMLYPVLRARLRQLPELKPGAPVSFRRGNTVAFRGQIMSINYALNSPATIEIADASAVLRDRRLHHA